MNKLCQNILKCAKWHNLRNTSLQETLSINCPGLGSTFQGVSGAWFTNPKLLLQV